MNRYREWRRAMLGGVDEPFDVLLFRGICLLGVLLSFGFVLPSNLLTLMPLQLNLLVAFNGLLMMGFYWASLRRRKHLHGLFLYSLMISLMGEWFYNAGAEGPSPLFYGLVVLVIVLFYRGWRLVAHLVVFSLSGLALLFMEYRWPYLIQPYHCSSDRMIDWMSAFVITCTATAFVLGSVLRAYERAHERALVALDRHREAESMLRESEALFQDAFTLNPDGLSITTIPEQRVVKVNDAWLRIFNYTREQAIGRTLWELGIFGEHSPRPINAPYATPVVVKGYYRTRDGAERSLIISNGMVQINGRLHMLSTLHDCTDQEMMQKQVQEAQKLEAVGRLAGGVAHDVNNVMQSILLSAQLLLRREMDEASRAKLRGMVASAQRGAMVASQLLAFSRQQPSQPRRIDVSASLEEMRDLLLALTQGDISLQYQVPADAGRVCIDPAQLLQIVINLVINSRDAIAGPGVVVISARCCYVYDLGECSEICVSDTGSGVPTEAQPHIFEPFFTTKEVGKGTGLGLSTVYGIAKQNGGRVELVESSSSGSTFRVLLPYCIG